MSSKSQSTGSTDNNQPTPTAHKSGMTRRDLLRRSAVGAATVGAVSTGAIRLDHGPVQNSQAIAPAVAAAGVGGSIAVGWALREFEVLGSGDIEGSTPEALHSSVYDTAQVRASTNASTFVDNLNILDGVEHSAYADAKIAAIDALNDQKTEEEVEEDALNAIEEYETTIKTNLLKSWNESVREVVNLYEAVASHPDLSVLSVFWPNMSHGDCSGSFSVEDIYETEEPTEMPNGDMFDVLKLTIDTNNSDGSSTEYWSPLEADYENYGPSDGWLCVENGYDDWVVIGHPDAENVRYLEHSDWSNLWEEINSTFNDVNNGISHFVSNIYGDVQSGDIETGELLTPREQAQLTAEDEDFPQAIADLMSLNVGVDLEREAEIYLPEVEATLYGQLAYSGDRTLEVGSVDPDATDEDGDPLYPGSIYFNYDISQGEGVWSAYETGVDGGTVTFTSEPFEQTVYSLTTTAGETVSFTTGDFEEDESNEEWTVDLSDQLDDAITQVESIEYYADTNGTQYETIQLQETFEIIDFTDPDGNSYDETNFERSEPQTDDNYITQEEWEEQQERHEELIQQYEDAQGSGISIPGVEDVLDGEANGLIGIAVVGMVLVSAILSALNPLS